MVYGFLKTTLRNCVSNFLDQFRILSPLTPLDWLGDDNPFDEYLSDVNSTKAELSKLVDKIVNHIELGDEPPVAPT